MRNWKTTVIGAAAGFFHLWSSGVNWKSAGLSILIGALGLAAKDAGVTGPGQ